MEIKQNLQEVPVIAKLFDISERHVRRLTAEGVLPCAETKPYRYDLLPTIRSYIKYLRERIEEQGKTEKIAKAEYDKLRADANLKQHQAAILKMQENDLDENMIDADDVELMIHDFMELCREKLLELPGILAAPLVEASSPAEASTIARKECNRLLNELAEYPKILEDRIAPDDVD